VLDERKTESIITPPVNVADGTNTERRITMKLGRFISNFTDPNRHDAKERFHFTTYADFAQAEEWQDHLDRLAKGVIGPPQGTEKYSVKQLKDAGLIGLYAMPTEQETVKGE
jgi:hypothetical protein